MPDSIEQPGGAAPAGNTSGPGGWEPLVDVIALSPGLALRMIEDHQNDGTGRCVVCSEGGQAGRYVWPCASRVIATRALVRQAQMHAERADRAAPLDDDR